MHIYEPYFNPEGHIYTTAEGTILDNVTSICKGGLGLYQHKRASPKAILGTHVHSALQFWDEKDLDESTLDPVIKPYLEQYKLALSTEGIEVLQNEVRRYHPEYLFAGSLDKIAKVKGEMSIIDIKTGKQEAWHMLQVGAYGKLMENEVKVSKYFALYITPESYELKEYDGETGFKYFLAIHAASKVRKALGY